MFRVGASVVVLGPVVIFALASCGSFEEAKSTTDAGDPNASDAARASGASVHCGTSDCDVSTGKVCCALAAGPQCILEGDCAAQQRAILRCDDTEDCRKGPSKTAICCAFQQPTGLTHVLKESACVESVQCDATGPQDQMCNPLVAGACNIAADGRTACAPVSYMNTPSLGFATCHFPTP